MRRFLIIKDKVEEDFSKKVEDILNDNEKDVVDTQYTKEGEDYIAFVVYRRPPSVG